MALHIGRVEANMDVTETGPDSAQAQTGPPAADTTMDMERLRPLVVRIFQEEMASFRRQQG